MANKKISIHDKIDKFLCWLDWRFLLCADDIPSDLMVCWIRVKRIFDYVPILWCDWDFNGDDGMFRLMRKKLERLEPELVHFVSAECSRRRIRVCIELLNRIINDTYEEEFYEKHDKKWGKSNLKFVSADEDRPGCSIVEFKRKNVRTPEDKKQQQKEYLREMKHAAEQKQNAIEYVMRTVGKYIQGWWD